MEFLGVFSSFLLTETEERVLMLGSISDWHVSETSGITLKDLLLSFFNEEKLHVSTDSLIGSLINTNEVAPFSGTVNSVVHDLTRAKLGFLLKDFLWGIGIIDICMVDICLSNYTKSILIDPSPEPDRFIDLTLFHLSLGIQVEDLNNSFGSLGRS